MIKILKITYKDFDVYGDFLLKSVSRKFINGKFTHVENSGSIMECEIFDDGLVAIGEEIGTIEEYHKVCVYCGEYDGHKLSCDMVDFSGIYRIIIAR